MPARIIQPDLRTPEQVQRAAVNMAGFFDDPIAKVRIDIGKATGSSSEYYEFAFAAADYAAGPIVIGDTIAEDVTGATLTVTYINGGVGVGTRLRATPIAGTPSGGHRLTTVSLGEIKDTTIASHVTASKTRRITLTVCDRVDGRYPPREFRRTQRPILDARWVIAWYLGVGKFDFGSDKSTSCTYVNGAELSKVGDFRLVQTNAQGVVRADVLIDGSYTDLPLWVHAGFGGLMRSKGIDGATDALLHDDGVTDNGGLATDLID